MIFVPRSGYVPFHEDVDIEARVQRSTDFICESEHNDKPYTVEAVVDKQFHRHSIQYEFLVKRIGYSKQQHRS